MQSIKRSVLHAMVWSKPLTQLGKELGISDVGLAKACRRHGIPVPPRGHWAKLAAGKRSEQTPLPEPDKDFTVSLRSTDPRIREQSKAALSEEAAVILAKAREMTQTPTPAPPAKKRPDRPHPLIRTTRRYVAQIPAMRRRHERGLRTGHAGAGTPYPPFPDKGCVRLRVPDGLNMTVSEDAIVWAIDWHEQLFRILLEHEIQISATKRNNEIGQVLTLSRLQETVYLQLSEGSKRHYVEDKVADALHRSERVGRQWEWVASGRFTAFVSGTEPSIKYSCAGTSDLLQAQLAQVAAAIVVLLERQPQVRQQRLAKEELALAQSQREEAERRHAKAHKEQLQCALTATDQYHQEQRLRHFLNLLEVDLPKFNEPYRTRLVQWIGVVRLELRRNPPHLQTLQASLMDGWWREQPPDWWPPEKQWPAL